jgi:hypothetical protein
MADEAARWRYSATLEVAKRQLKVGIGGRIVVML